MMKTTLETSEDKSTQRRRQSADPDGELQVDSAQGEQLSELSQRIAAGAAMTAQRKAIDGMISSEEAVQRQTGSEEEELMQGKFTAQRQAPEEEELLQGSFKTNGPRIASPGAKR